MNDAEKLAEMGTDARKWTEAFLDQFNENFGEDSQPVDDVYAEMQAMVITWFANAIEAGRDEGPNKEQEQSNPQLTKAERAIHALKECADALDDMPFRMSAMGGIFGQLPVNRTDTMRQEADHIVQWMDTTAAATAPPTQKKG